MKIDCHWFRKTQTGTLHCFLVSKITKDGVEQILCQSMNEIIFLYLIQTKSLLSISLLLLLRGTISCLILCFDRESNKDIVATFSLFTERSDTKAMNTHNAWN